ncbi:F-actin-monooxygenase Mical isoform X1 [Schistocerca americana]|uniref:F-actin-monooxygenase Mical isoform X1 n=1 Tax=Schistocerca americana TaxID=7009 RepID=UPI001F501C92|nr:F-actin-monooxygenase Mical isoform X1 [Schistocerca americana]
MLEPRKQAVPHEIALASEKFDQFCAASSLKTILGHFRELCDLLSIKPTVYSSFYPKLKSKLRSWKAQALWAKFDKRASHKCYNRGKASPNSRVLIIGAGPCGLRTAIEAQLLGAKVVVVEKRDRITRHNVLHLWPFVIHDLRALGAKKFFGKFCAGSIDHISIRQLQFILLKVALILGVEVHEGVGFEGLVEPPEDQSIERTGWRANVTPPDHPVSQYEFDVLIGADGKRNTLDGFKRKEFRGKLAIAITANFINRHSEAEAQVEEISGVAFIFNQKFFKDLYAETGIDLENIVYYKDETHYFVMTAKKQSLIDKGVILNDYAETAKLLAVENVNKDALQEYARQAADFSTNYRLPQLEFALNHYGQPDVAMFDFTSMFAAENASRVIERRGHRLLQILVGDSLLEPFWPTGSGCARGFLSSMDACWAVRSWGSGHLTPLEVIAERESIYRLLGQTTPENLQRDFANYTLDPHTRYPNLNTRAVLPIQVRGLYDTDDPTSLEQLSYNATEHDLPKKRRRKVKDSQVHPDTLLHWLKKQVALYSDLHVENMTDSFKNGLILCAIIHRYRPDLIDFHSLKPEDVSANNQLAFDTLERELGIPPVMTGKEMEQCDIPDKLTMLSYLSQIYDTFRGEIPHIKHPKLEVEPEDIPAAPRAIKFRHLQQLTPAQKVNLIGRISNTQHHNRSAVSRKRFSSDRDLLTGAGTPYGIGGEKKTETSRKSRSKRRSLEKERQTGDEEREKRLEEIRQNRLERERRRKYLRKLTTLQFYKSMQMLQTNARYENSQPFEDYSIFLYRQTAPSFEERVKDLERKLYYPDRDARFLNDIKRGGAGEDMSGRIKTLEEKLRGTTHTEKKPKDLLRAIGKIEKSDWNVMELEKKIQENKMGKGGRQENPEKVPKWSRDQFVDKFEAVKSKLETKTVDREKEKNDKYSDVDVTLKLIGKKLKEGNALEAGPRGSNKVSAMAEQFAVKTQDAEKPSIQRSNSKAALVLPAQGGSEMCHFCKKRVYLMERLSIEGRFFHRGCFRCEYCGTTLRLGSHLFDRDGCRFYCTQHFGMQGVQKMKSARKDQENYTDVGKTKIHGIEALLKHTDMAPEATPEKSKLHSIDAVDQRTTPERIEFENLVTSDVEELPGEMDEDEWTDRNFGTSAAEGSSDSVSDLSDSGDEDNEVFEEAVDQPFTADETRKLAEDWTRRYSRNTPAEVQNGSISKQVAQGNGEDESTSLNDGDTDGDMSGKESESDDDETETATEGDEDVKARELRKQEIYLKVPECAKVQSDTDSGSNTEVQSDDTTESSDEEIENSATEIETDSEFEHDGTSFPHNIPSIIVDDRNVTKRKRYNAEEPIKVHTRAGHIHPINGTVKPLLPSVQSQHGIRLKFSSVQPETANSFTASNLVTSKNLLNNNAKLPTSSQLTPLINPRQGNYLLNRTHSTEGIASKVSLELKKRYLLGTSDIGGTVRKSGSASTIDSKLKNFVDTISEHQKLLHPAPEPSPSMQAYLQGTSRVSSSSSTHFSPPSPTIIAPSLQLPQIQKPALRKEKELPDVEGSFEHVCGKKEAKVPFFGAEKSSAQADHASGSNAHTDEGDRKLLVITENTKTASNGMDNSTPAKVEDETDYRPRSPAHETSIVVPDMQWNLTPKTGNDNEENDENDDDDDDDDIETDSLSSGSSSVENDTKQKSDSHSSGQLPERITPRVEIHDSSGVLMTEDADVSNCTKQESVAEALFTKQYTEEFPKSDAISVEKVSEKSVVIDKSNSDLAKVRHNSVNSDHSSPSTPPSRSDFSESHEHEATFAALTETELSDWAHDGDAVVSEDLDDVEFNINPHFVTVRHHKKPKSSKNTPEKNFSAGYQKSIAKTEDLDDDSNKDKIHCQTEIPLYHHHEVKTVPCLLSDIENIEFMDTGEENESDSDDVLAATNKTLIKNSGYVQFVDSDDVVTPVLEIPALIEQTMPVPVLPTLIVSECDDNSDENDSSPKQTSSKESTHMSKEEDDNSLQRERTSTEEMTSDTDTVKEKLPNKCTNNDSTCEDDLFYTPKSDSRPPKNGGDSHTDDFSQKTCNNYASNCEEHVPTFSNIRDSINIIKSRQKDKDSLVLQGVDSEVEQLTLAPATNSEDYSGLHHTKSPNTSRKLKEISRERSVQKDIVHKMVLDKHLPQKRSSQDRKSRKCFSGIYSPPSLAPRRTSDPTLFPPNSPEKDESLIPSCVKKLEMPTVIPPSPGETDERFNSLMESGQDLKMPLSDDSVLVTEETEQFFTPLTSFKKTSKGSRPLSYHSSFKSSHRPSKFCRSPEKYSSSLPHTPLTNPEAFSLPDITKVLFKTPDITLKPPVAPPRTKHERKVTGELSKEGNNRRTEFTSNNHGELHKENRNGTPNITSVADTSVMSTKDSDVNQSSLTPLRSPVSNNSPTGICGSPVSSKQSLSPTSVVEALHTEHSMIASATDSRSITKERRKSKDPERRKSLIQAVSDFFHKKKDSTGSVSPPKTPTSSNQSHSKDGKFRLKFTKAKDKMKLAYSSCSDDSDDKESPNKHAQSSDVYRIKTADSVKDNEKRYGVLYDDTPPPIPPPPLNYLKNAAAHRASEESCSEVDEESRATILSTPSHEGTLSTGSLSRRHTRMQQRMSRQAQQKRLRMAQEIQRQLEEVEVKQKELEQRGVNVEKALRGESAVAAQKDEGDLLKEWFALVRERSELRRFERELLIRAEELELEDRHSRLQQELRERLKKDDSEKTSDDVEKEGQILNEMLEIVERRDSLIALLEEDRQRYQAEDRDLEAQMLAKGLRLTPLRKESHV